jgi:parallel beta-helix repeat protein
MDTRQIAYIIAGLMCVILSAALGSAGWCYQESANVSTACGGLATGAYGSSGNWYDLAKTYDGNWGTWGSVDDLIGNAYLYINYTKPGGASLAIWQVQGQDGPDNVSISSACFNAYANKIRLRVNSSSTGGGFLKSSKWDCWNGTAYTTLKSYGVISAAIYEEGMYWDSDPCDYYLDACKTSGWSDGVYCLSQNISTTGSCMIIDADNVTLEGRGFTISGNDAGVDYGVYSMGWDNIIVKNMEITDFGSGVYCSGANKSLLENITANSNSYNGIYISGSSNNLSDIDASYNGEGGIYIVGPSNTLNLSGNTVDYNCQSSGGSTASILFYGATSGNSFISTSISNNACQYGGIYFDELSSNNVFNGNTITNNSYSFTLYDNGINFKYGGSSNDFDNNNISNNGYYGVRLYDSFGDSQTSDYNSFNGDSFNNNGHGGLLIYDSDGVTETNITGVDANYNAGTYGVGIWGDSNNLSDIDASYNGESGIHIVGSFNTFTLSGNTINSNCQSSGSGNAGIYIYGTNDGNSFTSTNISNNACAHGGIYFGVGISNHSLTSVTFSGNSNYDIYAVSTIDGSVFTDTTIGAYFLASPTTLTFEDSTSGKINFTSGISGSGSLLFGSDSTYDVALNTNYAYVDSVGQSGFNKSANVTLYGTPGAGLTNPVILKDGSECLDCHNFTALTAATVIFNVTSWSNYTIGDAIPPVITIIPTTVNATISSDPHTINWTTDEAANCTLNVNGTEYTISGVATSHSKSIQGLAKGNYSAINVTCEDIWGAQSTSNNFWLNINDYVNFTAPTQANGTSITGKSWYYINVTSNFNASSCVLDWNGTNYAMSRNTVYNYYFNRTVYIVGNYTYNVSCTNVHNSLVYSTETRTIEVINPSATDNDPPEIRFTIPYDDTPYSYTQAYAAVTIRLYTDELVGACRYSDSATATWSTMTAVTGINADTPLALNSYLDTLLGPHGSNTCWYFLCEDVLGNRMTSSYQYCLWVDNIPGAGSGGGGEPEEPTQEPDNFRLLPVGFYDFVTEPVHFESCSTNVQAPLGGKYQLCNDASHSSIIIASVNGTEASTVIYFTANNVSGSTLNITIPSQTCVDVNVWISAPDLKNLTKVNMTGGALVFTGYQMTKTAKIGNVAKNCEVLDVAKLNWLLEPFIKGLPIPNILIIIVALMLLSVIIVASIGKRKSKNV